MLIKQKTIFTVITVFLFAHGLLADDNGIIKDNYYGNPIHGDSLINQRIGRWNERVSIRFKALYTGNIYAFRWYLVRGTGYSDGDGGDIKIDVYYDDANGEPDFNSGSLASVTIYDAEDSVYPSYLLSTFDNQVYIQANNYYHIVFENIHSNPTDNYISIDSLANLANESGERSPGIYNDDLKLLVSTNGGAWEELIKHTPIHNIFYTDGKSQGVSYVNPYSVSGEKPIGGGAAVRQIFTKTKGGTQTFSSLGLYIKKTPECSVNLKITLTNLDTSQIIDYKYLWRGYISTDYSWVEWTFDDPITLYYETNYEIKLTGSATNIDYLIYPLQEGGWGFTGKDKFTDGRAQYLDDGTFVNWYVENVGNTPYADLMFYLKE